MAAQKTQKKKPAKKPVAIVVRGKRKESIARASIREGKGEVRINGFPISVYGSPLARTLLAEPISMAGELAAKADISIIVKGGGAMGQVQACRTAIARALYKFSGEDASLKERMAHEDKFLLSEDVRRVEPKKYMGPKARARFQKSYR